MLWACWAAPPCCVLPADGASALLGLGLGPAHRDLALEKLVRHVCEQSCHAEPGVRTAFT